MEHIELFAQYVPRASCCIEKHSYRQNLRRCWWFVIPEKCRVYVHALSSHFGGLDRIENIKRALNKHKEESKNVVQGSTLIKIQIRNCYLMAKHYVHE